MSSPKTSKPDSSATKSLAPAAFDKLYWLRAGLGALGGVLAELLTTGTNAAGAVVSADWVTGVSIAMLVYLVSYYVTRFTWYKGLDREGQGKIYTTGLGSFVIIFLFTWMLLFTLQAAGYSV